ncbi:MAG TPA: UvrD-helicase domain-containing protein [Anaeromyxobacter sp.]|nr:UvrD-helicase domain-containing protein [Anaeromyxobacter sp.]
MNGDLVSAGAGTGKTYTLAKRLYEELDAGRVRPEGVVAFTYTVKAARELESRIRKRLLGAGKVELAARVRDGYIGTIHAVCQRLAREFALEAGLSPFLDPIPEPERRKLLALARAGVLRGREVRLNELAERLAVQDWGEPLRKVVDAARQNGLGAADLRASATRSREGLLRLLGPATLDEAIYLAGLRAPLAALLRALESDAEGGAATARERLAGARRLEAALAAGRRPTWKAQVQLANAVDMRRLAAAAAPFREHVARHLECRGFHDDLLELQRVLFEVAADTLDAFAEEKRAARVVDFGDMLALAHDLLGRPAVQAALRDRLDLVLVDEVQDISPLQLAVVTALGALARKSVWVGDRKQAIFGFQGSDPELMTAAIDAVLRGRAPEILGTSYRSRVALVEAASELFAGAFAGQGIPREQVVLAPEKPDPPGLAGQAPFACWRWTGGRPRDGEPARSEAHAIAEAVERLLATEPPIQVRERVERGVDRLRPATARDVAVLAFRNGRCSDVATALRQRGIPARVATAGLSETPEGRLARAAVALLADPRDGVAALEVSWISGTGASDPDGWLSRHLATVAAWRARRAEAVAAGTPAPRRPLAFADDARVEALRAASRRAGALSPSEAFDLALRAGGLPELLRSWPEPAQALANLEALRGEARVYQDLCAARRTAATALGLVEHLGSLAGGEDENADRQATPTADDAVTVSTWHRSKGLEWPIVILSDLNHGRDRSVFDPTTVAAPAFDFAAPLAGRWIRFWPWPYGDLSKDLALADRAAVMPEGVEAEARERRERVRLLYVGFTRARDLLGFVSEAGSDGPRTKALDPLRDGAGVPRISIPFERAVGLAKVEVGKAAWPCMVGELAAVPPGALRGARRPAPWYAPGPPLVVPPEIVNPSGEPFPVSATVKGVAPLGARSALASAPDMKAVGDAVHGFLAADPGSDPASRRELARRMLDGHGVAAALAPDTLLAAGDALRAWAEARWPGATWHREWPLRARLDGAPPRLLVGEADLVLETAHGFVLVDHKSFPGSAAERDRRLVEEYAPQLAWYARALERALGKPLLGAFVHFPLRAEIAEVGLGAKA